MSLPTNADLIAALALAGLDASAVSSTILDDARATALADFERDTGYSPFMADSVATTRPFDPPGPVGRQLANSRFYSGQAVGGGRLLDLKTGCVEIVSVTADGTVLDTTDYWGDSFQNDALPFTAIRFSSPLYATMRGVAVLARWGYADALPAPAKAALVAHSCLRLATALASKRRTTREDAQGAEKSREAGPIKVEFAAVTADKLTDYGDMLTLWQSQYKRGVSAFRLVSP